MDRLGITHSNRHAPIQNLTLGDSAAKDANPISVDFPYNEPLQRRVFEGPLRFANPAREATPDRRALVARLQARPAGAIATGHKLLFLNDDFEDRR